MLIGRARERGLLVAMLDDARTGKSRTVVIRGEPGIGKSTLLVDLAARAEGFRVLRARGIEAEAELPFSGLLDLVRPLLGHTRQLPAPQRAALEGALGIGPPAPADPFLLGAATLSLLVAAAEDAPLLCLIDDAQWIDRSSLAALLFAARRLEADPIAIVLAARDAETQSIEAEGVDDLALAGLAEPASRALLGRHRHLPEPVVARLLAVARGNPLALLELPASLTEAERRGERDPADPLHLSDALQAAYSRRIEDLSSDAGALMLLSAAEPSGDAGIILEASRMLSVGEGAWTEAERAGLLDATDGALVFRHPLVRSAAYYGPSDGDRREAHRALAQVHLDRGSHGDHAWHLAAAAIAPDEQVADALEAAAMDALARSGYAAASAAFERAAGLSEDREARARRLYLAGRSAFGAGLSKDRALDLLARAEQDARSVELRYPIQRLRVQIEYQRDVEAAYRLAMAEAAALEPTHIEEAAILFASGGFCAWRVLPPERALEAVSHARALAAQRGDSHAFFDVLYGGALLMAGELLSARPYLERAPELLDEFDDTFLRVPLEQSIDRYAAALEVLLATRDLARLRRSSQLLVERCRPDGLALFLTIGRWVLGVADYRSGDWIAARAGLAEVERSSRTLNVDLLATRAAMSLAEIAAARGDEEESRRHEEELQHWTHFRFPCELQHGTSALLAMGQGRFADAARLYRIDVVPAASNRVLVLSDQVADTLEAHIRAGEIGPVASLRDVFAAQAREAAFPWALARLARLDGLTSAEHEFEGRFREALRWHELSAEPFAMARTHLALGERLRRARRLRESREPLHHALEVFTRLGAKPWADRSAAELRATGERVRRAGDNREGVLTSQELEIALVIARGATNREAAEQLFLSPKTIERHLSHVYSKLGIRSRTQLTRLFARTDFGSSA